MVDASGAMEFDKIKKGTVMDDDFKLDKDQRRRANACLDQVIDDAEWASYAIIWQRDEIARLRALVEKRERQIVFLTRVNWVMYEPSDRHPDCTEYSYNNMGAEYGRTYGRLEGNAFESDAGLLAAVDEETK